MLDRFLQAQDNGVYERALSEIQSGQKRSHWMWFIFPQVEGLGQSYTARYYALTAEQAKQYFQNDILRERLLEISHAVFALNAPDIRTVFGYPDYLKFQSCMTLFSIIAPETPIFTQNLQLYFRGERCHHTEFVLKE